MNELLLRIRNIEVALTSDQSRIEIIILFLTEIAEMDFTKITLTERTIIEHYIQNIHAILKNYKIVGLEGYQNISNEHLNEIIENIMTMCKKLFLRTAIESNVCQ